MGTNYYVAGDECPHCGRGDGDIYIGKSSAGWVFALATYPHLGINTIADWLAYLNGKKIRNEYGDEVSFGDMISAIANRQGSDRPITNEWLITNGGVQGPNNLARSRNCQHGEGTWDYHGRDFS